MRRLIGLSDSSVFQLLQNRNVHLDTFLHCVQKNIFLVIFSFCLQNLVHAMHAAQLPTMLLFSSSICERLIRKRFIIVHTHLASQSTFLGACVRSPWLHMISLNKCVPIGSGTLPLNHKLPPIACIVSVIW